MQLLSITANLSKPLTTNKDKMNDEPERLVGDSCCGAGCGSGSGSAVAVCKNAIEFNHHGGRRRHTVGMGPHSRQQIIQLQQIIHSGIKKLWLGTNKHVYKYQSYYNQTDKHKYI